MPSERLLPDDECFVVMRQAMRQGDRLAREQMYLRYGPYFRELIQKRLKAKRIEWATTPHDVFNAVVLRLWEENALEGLASELDFLRYMSRAVAHEVCDTRRRLTARCRDYRRSEPLPDVSSSQLMDVRESLFSGSCWEALQRALAELPLSDRQMLDLWLNGENWTAIGERCGRSPVAQRKRFFRLIRSLRHKLSRADVEI